MPYERCIETWAREEGIGLIPGPGRRPAGQDRAKPGKAGRESRCVRYSEIVAGNLAFSCFLEVFFKTCDTRLRHWVVKSRPFTKLVLLC